MVTSVNLPRSTFAEWENLFQQNETPVLAETAKYYELLVSPPQWVWRRDNINPSGLLPYQSPDRRRGGDISLRDHTTSRLQTGINLSPAAAWHRVRAARGHPSLSRVACELYGDCSICSRNRVNLDVVKEPAS